MGPERLRIITDGIPLKVPDITSQGGTRLFTSAGLRRDPGGRGGGVCAKGIPADRADSCAGPSMPGSTVAPGRTTRQALCRGLPGYAVD